MLELKPFKMLETKVIFSYLFYFFGVPIALLGALVNIDTWKANVLFVLGSAILTAKLIYLCIDRYQKMKNTDLDLEEKRHNLNEKRKPKS